MARKQSEAQMANLKPGTFARDRDLAKRAGIKGTKAQKAKRDCKAIAELLLATAAPLGEEQKKAFAKMLGVKPDEITIALASYFAQAQKALKGDLASLAFLRDSAGQKPAEQVQITQPDFAELDTALQELSNG